MAEKVYYWLKLSDDFFNDKAIKKLRKIAGGDTYTIIYLKMLLLAVKQNNFLYFEGIEESFPKELALDLDEDEEDVSVACAFLEKKGLLKTVSEEEFLLTQCDEMVGSETDAARRKRKQRSRERIEGDSQNALQGYPKDFEEFWDIYPRKIGKGEAYKKYQARRKDGWSQQELQEAAKAYAEDCKRRKTEKEYIKHAKTFLSDSTPFVDYIPKMGTDIADSAEADTYEEWGK